MPKNNENGETLCWECKKSGGLCSWSHNLTPVKGWVATVSTRKTYIRATKDNKVYCVISCPEFVEG